MCVSVGGGGLPLLPGLLGWTGGEAILVKKLGRLSNCSATRLSDFRGEDPPYWTAGAERATTHCGIGQGPGLLRLWYQQDSWTDAGVPRFSCASSCLLTGVCEDSCELRHCNRTSSGFGAHGCLISGCKGSPAACCMGHSKPAVPPTSLEQRGWPASGLRRQLRGRGRSIRNRGEPGGSGGWRRVHFG